MEAGSTHALKAALLGYFASNKSVILSRLKVKSGPELEEAVHQLRVSTKKLRALYRLCAHISQGAFDEKKQIKPLRRLFKSAGPLRELQVHQGVIDVYELLHVAHYRRLARLLGSQRKDALAAYKHARAHFPTSYFDRPAGRIASLLADTPDADVLQAAIDFVQVRLGEIARVLPGAYDHERLHKARILLKEAMYIVGILQSAGITEPYDPAWLAIAKQASEVAGQWHDREVLLHWLQDRLLAHGHVGSGGHNLLLQDLQAHSRSMARDFRRQLGLLLPAVAEVQPRQVD